MACAADPPYEIRSKFYRDKAPAQAPNRQFPTPKHSSVSGLVSYWELEGGSWKWLGIGSWKLGIIKRRLETQSSASSAPD